MHVLPEGNLSYRAASSSGYWISPPQSCGPGRVVSSILKGDVTLAAQILS
jgi:hypothetical protein